MANRGISSLGLCHPLYNVTGLAGALRKSDIVITGWLDNFFNPNNSRNARRLLRKEFRKPVICRVHIINGPGLNNSRVLPHEITYGYTHDSLEKAVLLGKRSFLSLYQNRCKHLKKILDVARNDVELLISPWLEHKPIRRKTLDILADIATGVFGDIGVVDNPVTGPFHSGYIRERHGSNPGQVDIADLDGEDFEVVDMVRYGARHKDIKACYIWGLSDNGLNHKKPWQPPEKRTDFPTGREFKTYGYWVSEGAITVSQGVNANDLMGLNILKSEDGERKDFLWKLGDGKDHAIALFPRRFKNPFKGVKVVCNGRLLDCGKYRGHYTHDNSNRLIYDFKRHTSWYPDSCVLVADKFGWILDKPQFRID